MNKKLLFSIMGAAAVFMPSALRADDPTPPLTGVANNTNVQTQLQLNVKDNTKEVHFIQTNNDPYVFTKVYVLKNADPYELRPYIVNAIGGDQFTALVGASGNINSGRRINASTTKVEAIKYADGVSMLIVSAEDYRFQNAINGMTLDQVIETLDQPKIESSSGHIFTLYLPKYWSATDLSAVIQNVGMSGFNNGATPDPYELGASKDRVRVDSTLNGLLFYTPAYSIKRIQKMLDAYDKPMPEAVINYTVYEYESEIDDQVGSDFQAWKNGPGTDLFAVASKYSNGWDAATMSPARPYVNNSHARFFNFSPKWNTKYLDFLASKGKAQVLVSGSVSIQNNKEGYVAQLTRLADIQTGAARGSAYNSGITAQAYYNFVQQAITTQSITGRRASPNSVSGATSSATNGGMPLLETFTIKRNSGLDMASTDIVDFTSVRTKLSSYTGNGTGTNGIVSEYIYTLTLGYGYAFIDSKGKNLGKDINLYDATISLNGTVATYTDASVDGLAIQKAPTRVTTINPIGPNNTDYGFTLTMNPVVSDSSTTLTVKMYNTNLIGFNSDGSPRTSVTDVRTKVDVSNKGEKFVIGGLDKEEVIRSKSSVPYLGTIPVLGWAFTSEREVHKKTQIVAVVECIPVNPDTQVPTGIMSDISAAKEKIKNYGTKLGPINENDLGFDQYLLDSDKKGIDPLP